MCAVTLCCPPILAASTLLASLPTYWFARAALHPVWWALGLIILVVGLGMYIDLTVKCRNTTSRWLGVLPVNGTGVLINASLPQPEGTPQWFGVGVPAGMQLVNFTSNDLGYSTPIAWSPSPFGYENSPCWSEGMGAYFDYGIAISFCLSIGTALLLVSVVVKVLQKTVGTCCGRPILPEDNILQPVPTSSPEGEAGHATAGP